MLKEMNDPQVLEILINMRIFVTKLLSYTIRLL